jgi:putative protein-disulfide isomerase
MKAKFTMRLLLILSFFLSGFTLPVVFTDKVNPIDVLASSANPDRPLIIYINDPLCSWCYGFAPEIKKIREKYLQHADFRMIVGGLRPDGDKPLSDEMREFLRIHWEEIHQRTGQAFSFDILKSDFIYNTEPPCRAVVTMRKLKPEKEFDFYLEVQKAFYSENKNIHDPETYAAIAARLGENGEEFKKLFSSEEIKKETLNDFSLSESLGVYGYPAVLVKKRDKIKAITKGYDTFKRLEKKLDKLIIGKK